MIQNSHLDEAKGRLYLVPTPIGNLEDMTFRAIRILREVDLIAAEDTRHTRKLLTHFDIDNDMISYHEHNRKERIAYLLKSLKSGQDIALVSDAGMPAISDPGYELVLAAIEEKVPVLVLPGANAGLTALVGSGLATDRFTYLGFLPRKKSEKEAVLQDYKRLSTTVIIYESPHRVQDSLRMILDLWGDRQVVIARELTKLYEQYIRSSISEVLPWLEKHPLKGECVLIIEGARADQLEGDTWWKNLSIQQHVTHYEVVEGRSHKDAMRAVAKDRQLSRRDVYQELHVDK